MPAFPTLRPSRAWSSLRYILPSLGLLCTFIIIGLAFYRHSQELMKTQIREQLRTTAAVAAGHFSPAELDSIKGRQDLNSPTLRSVVLRLGKLKDTIPNARYVYIMRRTENPNTLEFIADNDSLKSTKELDENGNGVLEPNEEPSWPGDPYDVSDIPALRDEAFMGPAVDADVVEDQWGSFFSGYAPIRRIDGTVAAVIGVDIKADDYQRLISQVFSPVAMLLFFLMGLAFSLYFLMLFFERRDEVKRRIQEIRAGVFQLTFHQLGSPLTAFKWSLELLKEHEAGQIPDKVIEEHIHVMEEGIAFMTHLINDLEEADKIQSGRLVYEPRSDDLAALVRDVVGEYRIRAERNHQTIEMDLPKNVLLPFDRRPIAAALREIIDNALVYSNPQTTVTVRLKVRGRFAEVSVTDQGIGIPSDEYDRVFSEFGRASNATKAHPSGSGLALYIAKGIVERAGGTLKMESIEGSGSTFTFRLPL